MAKKTSFIVILVLLLSFVILNGCDALGKIDDHRNTDTKPDGTYPGLDAETFQQNIGLSPAPKLLEPISSGPRQGPVPGFPNTTFVSYRPNEDLAAEDSEDLKRSRNVLSGFAKKARNLVALSDEDNPLSIRDLQPTADLKSSFHAPVFPKPPGKGGEDDV